MRRSVQAREWLLIEAALAKATSYGFALDRLRGDFRTSITVEVMNRNFTKYHLGRGFALHRFTGIDLGPPHDHPCDFTTLILEPYVEERYHRREGGGWSCERFDRVPGSTHLVAASMVHQIVALPNALGSTLVKYGSHLQQSLFYRFGVVVEARTARQRRWMIQTW